MYEERRLVFLRKRRARQSGQFAGAIQVDPASFSLIRRGEVRASASPFEPACCHPQTFRIHPRHTLVWGHQAAPNAPMVTRKPVPFEGCEWIRASLVAPAARP